MNSLPGQRPGARSPVCLPRRVPPVLTRQRDHARNHGQTELAALFVNLIKRVNAEEQTP